MKSSYIAPLLGGMLLATSAITPVRAQNGVAALPRTPAVFTGKLGPTMTDSIPDYALLAPVKAPQGAPNILVILTDDVGFSASSTFGGPVPTPNLDRLAAHGLKYNQFQTTAICSATRAALLTGRNQHDVGVGDLADIDQPYPGYTGMIPANADTVADVLRGNGYATAMFGKNHDTPSAEQSAAGPFGRWPTGMGFDYFYGFVGGDSDQFQPNIYVDTRRVDGSTRSAGYMLDNDLANRAIEWIDQEKSVAPDKPFFIYYAPGSTHAPHQAPADWIVKFRGQFNMGWNELRVKTLARQKAMGIAPANTSLSPWPKQIPLWNSLTPDQKVVDERYMEVYAAQLAYQDAQIGRVLDEIQRMGLSDNTIVLFIEGDNGASGEGGPGGSLDEQVAFNNSPADEKYADPHWLAQHLDIMGGPHSCETYPAGWALAMDTPFPWTKQIASHLGGTRNGLVISWPGHINDVGQIRTQYAHVTDIMPTLLQIAHVKEPDEFNGIKQKPLDGVSLAYTFDDPAAPSRHQLQYYEMLGNRGIYYDGWLANTTPRNMPWEIAYNRPDSDVSSYNWELYNLNTDYSQAHNIAAKYPDKLKAMQAMFGAEALKHNVYPIQDSGLAYRIQRTMVATMAIKFHYVFWDKHGYLPNALSPAIFSLPFSIKAEIDVPAPNTTGVIVAAGSWFGGWSFYLKDGKPTAYSAASNLPGMQTRISAAKPLAAGHYTVLYNFSPTPDEGGTLTISVNGNMVAQGRVAHHPVVMAGSTETFDIGRDSGVPVTDDYSHEGIFPGKIEKVDVDLRMPKGLSVSSLVNSRPRFPD